MALQFSLLGVFLLQLLSTLTNNTIRAVPTDEIVIQQQVYSLKRLILELHKIHHFENIVLYRTSTVSYMLPRTNILALRNKGQGRYLHEEILGSGVANILADFIWSSEVQKPLASFIIAPWNYVNNTQPIPNLGNILNNKNLAIVILNNIFDVDLKEFVASSLGACLETKIVFFSIGHEMTNALRFVRFQKIKQFFHWCWSKNILNAILVYQKQHITQSLDEFELEVYTYTPFPRPIKIIQLTNEKPEDYFPCRMNNLLGYKFKAPMKADKPLVFKTPNPLSGAETVSGISGKTFMEYIENVNATFEELKNENANTTMGINMNYIYALLKSHIIDISIHPITALVPHNFSTISTSYPISNRNNCVIAPMQQNTYLRFYIPEFLNLGLWIPMIVLFAAFHFTYMYINRRIHGRLKPWLAFSTTLKGMLYMPVDNMGPSKTISKNSVSCRAKIWLHMPLLLTGMIFSLVVIASMTSFYSSSTLYFKPIESLEDLAKANLTLMMTAHIYEIYKYLDLIQQNFSQNLIITDADTVYYHLSQLDSRYAYTVYHEEWQLVQHYFQKHLRKPQFQIVPQLCIPNVYLNLPIQFNSPFYYSLQNFILNSQASGLDIKWSNIIYWQINQTTNTFQAEARDDTKSVTVFGLEDLTHTLYIYVGGMIVASLVFLVELKLAYLCEELLLY